MVGAHGVWTKKKGCMVTDYAEKFAARLRQALERSGMKQTQLYERLTADGIEVNAGSLSHYFNGRNYPNPDVLAGIAKHLEVSTDWLMFLTETRDPAAAIEEKLAQASGKAEINTIMEQLPKEEQTQLMQFANYLLAQNPKFAIDIAPLPLSEKQRNVSKARKLFQLIERDWGEGARDEVREVFRSKGIFIDPIT